MDSVAFNGKISALKLTLSNLTGQPETSLFISIDPQEEDVLLTSDAFYFTGAIKGKQFDLEAIDVNAAYKHRGIGSALINFFLDKDIARYLGYTTIITLPASAEGQAFFKKFGFEKMRSSNKVIKKIL